MTGLNEYILLTILENNDWKKDLEQFTENWVEGKEIKVTKLRKEKWRTCSCNFWIKYHQYYALHILRRLIKLTVKALPQSLKRIVQVITITFPKDFLKSTCVRRQIKCIHLSVTRVHATKVKNKAKLTTTDYW